MTGISNKKTKIKKIYFIGIKGVGMTMLAQFLAQEGKQVLGSDIPDQFLTDKVLKQAHIKVKTPFTPENIPLSVDLIVYSSAYTLQNNSELKFIAKHPERFKKIPLLSYAAAFGELFNRYQGLAVCGSHGKTTTSAWLGYVLWRAGQEPNVLVGSRVPQFHGSSLHGSASYLLAEVDEYQNKLQYFKPWGVILNNIDYDHPDFFKTPLSYLQVFRDFIKKVPSSGFLVFNNHDLNIRKIKKHCLGKLISYDLKKNSNSADYLASDIKMKNSQQSFQLSYHQQDLGEFRINLIGEHNIFNALAVIASAQRLGVPLPLLKKYLAAFQGTERRNQILGTYQGAIVIDDYAHHPTEIQASLGACRLRYADKNLITVFHPHTFTRTRALFADFVKSFSATDELIILDIYSSAREKRGGVSSLKLVRAIQDFNKIQNSPQKVKYIPQLSVALRYLQTRLQDQDLLLLMGAGDVFRIGQKLLGKS